MAQQTITALYDSREYANNAALMLRQAGIPDSDVTMSPEAGALGTSATVDRPATGFWASLENMFGDTDDRHTYAEGVRRGGTMITVHVDDHQVDDAVAMLEKHGSVDMNERETAWRSEGWSGATAVTGGGVASEGAGPIRSVTPVADTTVSTATALKASDVVTPTKQTGVGGLRAAADDVVQVVEESLNVGKRAVNRGKVRLHTYVVEKPVTESVTLRDETVSIDRRPVDRALAAADLGVDAFKDRTIEMDELSEEAVVGKTTRVVEEIGISKKATDRVETINDSVRSTKVDIEDGRVATGTGAGLMGDFSTRLAADMDVIGSDGQHVGVIDHVDGPTIKLKKMDPASGGQHHLIPTDWVKSVDGKVMLKTAAADVMSRWTAA